MKALLALLLIGMGLQTTEIPEEEYYDFWVGEWAATWDEGDGKMGKGTNSITKILDGKVIQENFQILEGQSKGFKGMSHSVYRSQFKTWKQAWVDNQGGYFDFTGRIDGDKRYFETQVFDRGEKQVQQRMVFYDIQKDSFTWDWESSQDGGETWTLNWRISYTRTGDS